ncbi:MAG: helix-turn-helix transcriptional regulator [Lachnospiraceae bacterium]|nr:helix-turn-helix transcriptional regulator [Lachnospiraceae bacterium]
MGRKTKKKTAEVIINNLPGIKFFLEKRDVETSRLHLHTFFELEIILSGHGTTTINQETFPVSKGTVYLLCPGDMHATNACTEDTLTLWSFSFMRDVIPDSILEKFIYNSGTNLFTSDPEEFDHICTLADIISREQKKPASSNDELSECCMKTLLLYLSGYVQEHSIQKEKVIQKALEYIELHYRENLLLKDVAAVTGLVPQYFCSFFHKNVGCSYKEYLTMLRIRYAKKLIRVRGFSPTQACYESGFNSYSVFAKAFIKLEGVSPKCYVGQSEE